MLMVCVSKVIFEQQKLKPMVRTKSRDNALQQHQQQHKTSVHPHKPRRRDF